MYNMFVIFWYRTSRKVDWLHDSEFPRPCWAPFVGHAASSPFIRGRSWPWPSAEPLQRHRSEAAYQKALREVHTAGLPLNLSMQWWNNVQIQCRRPSIWGWFMMFMQPIFNKFGMDVYFILLGSQVYIRLDVACCCGIWQLRYKQVRTEGKTEELKQLAKHFMTICHKYP